MNVVSLWARRSNVVRTLARPLLAARRHLREPGRIYQEEVWGRLSHMLAEDPVVHVEEFGGSFLLDARSDVLKRLLLDGAYEPRLAEVCRETVPTGRDAIDVGANAGFFSVLLATLLPDQRVLAAEPSQSMAGRLRENLMRNGVDDRVIIFEGALSSEEGRVELQGPAGREEYGTIGVLAHPAAEALVEGSGAEVRFETVPSEPLDALVGRHGLRPGFIKVDTEGAEMLVFQGALETLREFRPVILSEVDDRLLRANGTSAMEVVALLQGEGYRVLDPYSAEHRLVTQEQLETPYVLTEVLCLPDSSAS